jgi:hypothetical protein
VAPDYQGHIAAALPDEWLAPLRAATQLPASA